ATLPPFLLFVFTPPPPTHLYTLSLHDALPIYPVHPVLQAVVLASDVKLPERVLRHLRSLQDHLVQQRVVAARDRVDGVLIHRVRSEEHTSELQSRGHLVCRLLLEKKKNKIIIN